ncbi:E3 ubiquitin-protein ligase RFI2-like isoform X1 [Salvia divinorum]|uniref:E3 ubiquitin-protein ligase RFI2-like isoform X1 n=1 Tax=Salvia divinorum TaxID=28513 RepID=A0ABD1H3L5_SALDI
MGPSPSFRVVVPSIPAEGERIEQWVLDCPTVNGGRAFGESIRIQLMKTMLDLMKAQDATTDPTRKLQLETLIEEVRSWAKLQCGHQFHLDCIGSAFNIKGAMQCPNCRKIEKGQWLYANGGRQLPESAMDDWAHDEDLYDLSYSEMLFGVHWCPFSGLTRLPSSFDEGEFPSSAYHDHVGHHTLFAEHGPVSSTTHPCPYIAYFGTIHTSSSTSSGNVSDGSNFSNHWSGLPAPSEINNLFHPSNMECILLSLVTAPLLELPALSLHQCFTLVQLLGPVTVLHFKLISSNPVVHVPLLFLQDEDLAAIEGWEREQQPGIPVTQVDRDSIWVPFHHPSSDSSVRPRQRHGIERMPSQNRTRIMCRPMGAALQIFV